MKIIFDCFWIVYGPTGETNPRVIFSSKEKAEEAALIMAQRLPEKVFYAMKSESSAIVKTKMSVVIGEPKK